VAWYLLLLRIIFGLAKKKYIPIKLNKNSSSILLNLAPLMKDLNKKIYINIVIFFCK
jgi:hypothetical protein